MRSGRPALHVTRRQAEILRLASHGQSDKEIAAVLGVSVATVRTHLERFYKDNQLHNKTEAVAAFLRNETDGDGQRPARQ